MIGPSYWRVLLLIGGVSLLPAPASAQLALPGAAPTAAEGAPGKTAPAKKAKSRPTKEAKSNAASAKSAAGVASIDGRPLMLSGKLGLLQVSGKGEMLTVEKLSLAGEGVSDASQRCVVNIIGAKPVEASLEGKPDGLARYLVDVPACPFAFDVVDGAVLVPAQITACVFKAADCQTSPSGLWGPDGAALESEAAAIGKRRTEAENAMSRALQALAPLAKDNPEVAALLKEQSTFTGERDDVCHDYANETAHGFCAASVTAARAALLDARFAALKPQAKGAGADKSAKHKKAKDAADAAAR